MRASVVVLGLLTACTRMAETTTPEDAYATAIETPPPPLTARETDEGRYFALEDLLGRRLDELPDPACGPDVRFAPLSESAATEGVPARRSARCLSFRGPQDVVDAHVSELEGWVSGGTAVTVVTEDDVIVFAIATKAYPDHALALRVFDFVVAPLERWLCDERETAPQAHGVAVCEDGPGFAIAQVISSAAPGGGSGHLHQVFVQVARDRATAEAVLPLLSSRPSPAATTAPAPDPVADASGDSAPP